MSYGFMGMSGVGFFGFLLIGFLAGWIAEKVTKNDHGFLTNILVGIAGSFVGGAIAGLLGFDWYGFIGNLAVASAGAIGILWFFGKAEAPRTNSRGQGGRKPLTEQGAKAKFDEFVEGRKPEEARAKNVAKSGKRTSKKPVYHSKKGK